MALPGWIEPVEKAPPSGKERLLPRRIVIFREASSSSWNRRHLPRSAEIF